MPRGHRSAPARRALATIAAGGERGGPVRRVATRTVRTVFAHNAGEWAAAIAYYALLSSFPLLLVAGSVAALVADPEWAVERVSAVLGGLLPEGSDFVEGIVDEAVASRGRLGLISAVPLIWTGSRVAAVLTLALDAVSGDDDPADARRRFLVSVALLLGLGVVFLLALAAGVLLDGVWDALGAASGERGLVFGAVRLLIRAGALLLAFFLVYRFVPRGTRVTRPALVGAATATALFLAAHPLFLLAIRRTATYEVVYGPLAAAALLMVWAWVVAFVTLVGGQVAYHTRDVLGGRDASADRPAGAVDPIR